MVDARSLRRHLPGPAHFEAALTGRALRGAYRRGKYLWLTLSEADGRLADEALVVHLGMSGQLLVRDEPDSDSGSDSEAHAAFDKQPRHLRVVLELDRQELPALRELPVAQRAPTGRVPTGQAPGSGCSSWISVSSAVCSSARWYRTYPWRAGEMAPGEGSNPSAVPERFLVPEAVKHIARDPLDEFFDPVAVRRKFLRTSSGIKKVLLDQSVISGVGNIYADEALWRARLTTRSPPHPQRRADPRTAGGGHAGAARVPGGGRHWASMPCM